MKSLLELEQGVRALEKGLAGLKRQTEEIRESIEAMRDPDNGEEVVDFKKIELLARYIPFRSHPLSKETDGVKRFYLIMLLYIVRLDAGAEANQKQLVFLQWMQKQSGTKFSLKELLEDAYKADAGTFQNFVEGLPGSLKELFIVDAMLVATIGGRPNEGVLKYIAALCKLLEVKDITAKTASIAQCILTQSCKLLANGLLLELLEQPGIYEGYVQKKRFSVEAVRRACDDLQNHEDDTMAIALLRAPSTYGIYGDLQQVKKVLFQSSVISFPIDGSHYRTKKEVSSGVLVEKGQLIVTQVGLGVGFKFISCSQVADKKHFAPRKGFVRFYKVDGVFYGIIASSRPNTDRIFALYSQYKGEAKNQ